MTTHKSFCRFCHANCAIEVDVDRGVPVAVRGDPSDPVFGGYTCLKGRELPSQTRHPDRLLRSRRRNADGAWSELDSETALDEIAARLDAIRRAHGARAIATYNGTAAFQNSAGLAVSAGFHKGLGSPSYYTSVTIDQPAKVFTGSRVGQWLGGLQGFAGSDVMMFIGNNPLTSHYSPAGTFPPFSPSQRLRDAKARGLAVICIDPRVTPTARLADIHLQVRPGEDATLLAAMLKVILDERLHDADFCARWVDGLDALHGAIARYTPEYAAHRADVPADGLVAAARLFARGPRGVAVTGTGPEMAPRGTLTEHLVMALNIACGRFCRAGETVPFPRVLSPPAPRKAQVAAPAPVWGPAYHQARVRGLTQLGEEMPTATLADEILLPGDGQIRALLCIGGNPIVAFPNQHKVRRAMEALDLLVCIDIAMSQTAKLAHYVIAPTVTLERDDITILSEWWYEEPYARYTEAVVPRRGDVIDEWEFFWGLAKRLGTEIPTAGGPLPMERKPTKFEVLEQITDGSSVPLARIRDETRGGGRLFPEAVARIEAADPDATDRFDLAPADVPAELRAMREEPLEATGRTASPGFEATHLLISRRTKQFFNSSGQDLDALRARGVTNFAYMHPSDVLAHGLDDGAIIEIAAPHASIHGVVRASDELKPGVISMAHAFGDADGGAHDVAQRGASTNRLVDDERGYDPITGQCRQSAIPVRIVRADSTTDSPPGK